MKPLKAFVLGTTLIALFAAFGIGRAWLARTDVVRSEAADSPKEANVDNSKDDGIRAQLDALTREVSRLKGQLEERHDDASVMAQPTSNEASTGPARTTQDDDEQWRAEFTELEVEFAAERLDPVWSSQTTRRIETELANDIELRNSLRKMECRSQSCRLELVENQAEGLDSLPLFLHKLGTSLPISKSDLVDDGPGKSIRVVYLLQRDGSSS